MKLDPAKGYRDRYLHLPLSKIRNTAGIKSSLTFKSGTSNIRAWSETATHLVVPREYLTQDDEIDLEFEVEQLDVLRAPTIDPPRLTYELRDAIQKTGWMALMEQGSGILSLGCGRGKTVVALHAWQPSCTPMLVVVHTVDLMTQWREKILEHTDLRPEDIGTYQGSERDWEKPITLASIQSLARHISDGTLPVEFQDHFGVVTYDEAHHLAAPTFNTTAAICSGIRRALTATHRRDDGLDPLYKYHIGPVLYENLSQDMIPECWFVQTGATPTDAALRQMKRGGNLNFSLLCDWLSTQESRNRLIKEYIDSSIEEGRKILALSRRVSHLEALHSAYKNCGLLHGAVSKSTRRDQLHDYDLVFATTELAREGLDRPDLDTVMILLPVQQEGWVQQIIGRIQRTHPGKKTPRFIVFEDENIRQAKDQCRQIRAHLTSFGYQYRIIRS